MDDDSVKKLRLVQLRQKLLRIEGHKELSDKQILAATRIAAEIADIETPNWREDIEKVFEDFRKKNVD